MPTKWTMWKKWIEVYNLPRLDQQEIDNWNRGIATNETELTTITKKKDGFTGQFQQKYQEELLPILLKILKIFEE